MRVVLPRHALELTPEVASWLLLSVQLEQGEGVGMVTIDWTEVSQRPMRLRHAVRDGQEVSLTFRNASYAAVIPWAQRMAELDELAALRERVAELEQTRGGQEAAA